MTGLSLKAGRRPAVRPHALAANSTDTTEPNRRAFRARTLCERDSPVARRPG
jgi:hypothetical protein